jgi:ABC-2 type transport system ATP-binding protein
MTAEPAAYPGAAAGSPAAGDPTTLEPAITVRGLRMSYGTYEAVRGIDLDVTRGEILAFLGPNGAGKTTTVEILEGFRKRFAGEVRVLGADPASAGPRWRARIGVVLQTCSPERLLTVRECLDMYAGYYPRPLPVPQVLSLTGLTEKASSMCEQLSGGQQRRLDVALALIGDPELVFLDEPTTGFDPSARRLAWDVIAGLRDLGKTIFLTTHFMDEAEALADRIVVLAAGRVVASGTPQSIGGRSAGATTISFTLPDGVTADQVPVLPGLDPGHDRLAAAHGRVEIGVADPVPALHALTGWAMERRLKLPDLAVSRPSLEDIYLQLTAGGAR